MAAEVEASQSEMDASVAEQLKVEKRRLKILERNAKDAMNQPSALSTASAQMQSLAAGAGGRGKAYMIHEGQIVDPNLRVQMWRPDRIETCPCGEYRYALTMEFVGSNKVKEAMRPVIDTERGMVVQMAWQYAFADDGSCLIPEDLRRDEETVEHFGECRTALEEMTVPAWSDSPDMIVPRMKRSELA